MLQFKSNENPVAVPDHAGKPQLPVYVQPGPDEALLSWVMRLASRLNVSVYALAKRSFGVDDRTGHSQWWCHPDPWLLMRISERADVPIDVLRRMTFQGWAPPYREDDANERFGGRRFDAFCPQKRAIRLAVCGYCFAADPEPYLRPSWLIGWVAVCPKHETRLTVRCVKCRSKLSLASVASAVPFAPRRCTRCGGHIGLEMQSLAHPSVIRLQAALLRGKRDGVTDLDGLGRLSWPATVMLLDVLVGMFWTGTTLDERHRILDQYVRANNDTDVEESGPYDCRYGALMFLAWLTDGWPVSSGASVGRTLLERWLQGKHHRISHHLRAQSVSSRNAQGRRQDAQIRERLWNLLASANSVEQPSVVLRRGYSIHD